MKAQVVFNISDTSITPLLQDDHRYIETVSVGVLTYVPAFSLLLALIQAVSKSRTARQFRENGVILRFYQLTRFFACLALAALSGRILFRTIPYKAIPPPEDPIWLRLRLTIVYGYATILSLGSDVPNLSSHKYMTSHLCLVLLTTWCIYAWRDLWPLATYNLSPVDQLSRALWTEISLLSYVAVVVPLVIPHQYIPLDPKEASEPHPEQTASWLSRMFFLHLESTIFRAWRMPHLSADQLPPLPESDFAGRLVKRSFPALDPFHNQSRRHIFVNFVLIYWKDYLLLSSLLILRVFTAFAAPLGTKYLLG